MGSPLDDGLALKHRLGAGQAILGVFFKTPHHHTMEVLGGTGLDLVVIDAEHAPFDDAALDACLLAARAAGLPALVRVREGSDGEILAALDLGASGVVVPHVGSAQRAAQAAGAARYGARRGFSGSHRAAGYGRMPGAEYRRRADESVLVVCQVEDRDGVAAAGSIAATAGVDAVLIGPADLCVDMGADSPADPAVAAAIAQVCAGCREAGTPAGIALPDPASVPAYRDLGMSLFLVGTDQSLLASAVRTLAESFRGGSG